MCVEVCKLKEHITEIEDHKNHLQAKENEIKKVFSKCREESEK